MRRLILVALTYVSLTAVAQTGTANAPRVFLLDGKLLAEQRARISTDKGKDGFATLLKSEADRAMNEGPFSVMQKAPAPPSGNKHDYMSQAPYFWADPQSKNGLPYIRRDGERNPEIRKISDHDQMGAMAKASRTLALAYYIFGDEAYAKRAAGLLRTWFLDPATSMNPNLQFAQGIPGVTTGRGIGIIETRSLVDVVDAIGLLAGSSSWTPADQRGMEKWVGEFSTWLEESANGRAEANARNNHGTYYDVQLADFCLFLGKSERAREILNQAKSKRIAAQIEPDGREPLELARTRSLSYSVMNLNGLTELARLGEHVGVDLWQFQTADGRAIRRALDFLLPYALGEKPWTGKQITEFHTPEIAPALLRAAEEYEQPVYVKAAENIGTSTRSLEATMFLAARQLKAERAKKQ